MGVVGKAVDRCRLAAWPAPSTACLGETYAELPWTELPELARSDPETRTRMLSSKQPECVVPWRPPAGLSLLSCPGALPLKYAEDPRGDTETLLSTVDERVVPRARPVFDVRSNSHNAAAAGPSCRVLVARAEYAALLPVLASSGPDSDLEERRESRLRVFALRPCGSPGAKFSSVLKDVMLRLCECELRGARRERPVPAVAAADRACPAPCGEHTDGWLAWCHLALALVSPLADGSCKLPVSRFREPANRPEPFSPRP